MQIVANELLANAIVHARSAPVLSLEAAGSDLLLRVADTSPTLPVARTVTPEETGGRGLVMVAALGDRWGADANASGKVVWVAFEATFP